jgi:phasin
MRKNVALQQKRVYRDFKQRTPIRGRRRKKMSSSPFEIPNEMRDFAERSVEQARKAFEGFLTVAQRATGAAGDAAATSQGGAKSVGAHVLSYTERNVNAAFDLAQKLVKAKDPQEALALQSEYLKAQLAALQEQAKELGSIVQKSITPGSN